MPLLSLTADPPLGRTLQGRSCSLHQIPLQGCNLVWKNLLWKGVSYLQEACVPQSSLIYRLNTANKC